MIIIRFLPEQITVFNTYSFATYDLRENKCHYVLTNHSVCPSDPLMAINYDIRERCEDLCERT